MNITIQKTSKPIKLLGAVMKLGLAASILTAIYADGLLRGVAVGLTFLFLLGVILVRWARWWFHD